MSDKAQRPLLILKYHVKPEDEAAFNAWYDSYMGRFLGRVPECLNGRRVVCERNGVKEFMSIYEIESAAVVEQMFKNIGQDTPQRIKDSGEWHEWEHHTLSSLEDGVYYTIQYAENCCCCK